MKDLKMSKKRWLFVELAQLLSDFQDDFAKLRAFVHAAQCCLGLRERKNLVSDGFYLVD